MKTAPTKAASPAAAEQAKPLISHLWKGGDPYEAVIAQYCGLDELQVSAVRSGRLHVLDLRGATRNLPNPRIRRAENTLLTYCTALVNWQ